MQNHVRNKMAQTIFQYNQRWPSYGRVCVGMQAKRKKKDFLVSFEPSWGWMLLSEMFADASLAWPDRFFPFFFVVAQRKTEKSGLATRDYADATILLRI